MKQIDIRKTAEDSLAIYKGQFRYWSEKFILAIEKNDETGIREANEGIDQARTRIHEFVEFLETL